MKSENELTEVQKKLIRKQYSEVRKEVSKGMKLHKKLHNFFQERGCYKTTQLGKYDYQI